MKQYILIVLVLGFAQVAFGQRHKVESSNKNLGGCGDMRVEIWGEANCMGYSLDFEFHGNRGDVNWFDVESWEIDGNEFLKPGTPDSDYTVNGYTFSHISSDITYPVVVKFKVKPEFLSQYLERYNSCPTENELSLEFTVRNCCTSPTLVPNDPLCLGDQLGAEIVWPRAESIKDAIDFTAWSLDDVSIDIPGTTLDEEGTATLKAVTFMDRRACLGDYTEVPPNFTMEQEIEVVNCFERCDSCNTTFQPQPCDAYWLSAWVNTGSGPVGSEDVGIALKCYNKKVTIGKAIDEENPVYYPQEQSIEGWKRITEKFTIPCNCEVLTVELVNDNPNAEVYFDDIRIHPFNSNMRSFVYDPISRKLMAELDDRNYATFYEYDEAGHLVRTKKETERGVKTLQETRSNSNQ